VRGYGYTLHIEIHVMAVCYEIMKHFITHCHHMDFWCTHTHTRMRTHTRTCTCTHMYTHTHTHTHTHTYAHTHTHTHTHAHTHSHAALYTRKIAFHPPILHVVSVQQQNRALNLSKYIHLQNTHTCPQKSPKYAQKSPCASSVSIGKNKPWTSSKEPYPSAK